MQWNVPILSVQFHKLWQIHTLIWASPEPSSCRAFPHPTNFPHVLLSQPLVPLWPHWSAFDHCRLDLFSRAFHVNTPRSFLSPLSSPLPCDPFCKMSKQEGLSVWQFLYGRKKWRPPDVRGVLPKVHRKQWRARRAAQGLDSPFRAYSPPYLFPAIWLEVQRYIVFNPTFSWAPLESHFNCAYDFTLNLLCLFWGSLATLSKGWSKTDDECGEVGMLRKVVLDVRSRAMQSGYWASLFLPHPGRLGSESHAEPSWGSDCSWEVSQSLRPSASPCLGSNFSLGVFKAPTLGPTSAGSYIS